MNRWLVLFPVALLAVPLDLSAQIGVCGSRPLPEGRTRHLDNLRLECGSGVDHFIRRPIPFDMRAWKQARLENDFKKMQEIGQDQPLIKWKGRVHYDTIEVWDWEEWVYEQNEYHCGSTTDTYKDADGKEHEVKTINSCWFDDPRHEEVYCSTEYIDYDSQFIRPTWNEWNPSLGPNVYYAILPNKYDLLPGETEDVQFFANWGTSTTVAPYVSVGNQWNRYKFDLRVGGASSFACRYNNPQHAQVAIHTEGRIKNRATPNAFRNPVDEFGQETANFDFDEYRPRQLKLKDASTELIEALAETSRNFDAQIQQEKFAQDKGVSTPLKEATQFENDSGFWAETEIRIRLFKNRIFGEIGNPRVSHASYNFASQVSQWWDGSNYIIPLTTGDKKSSLYRQSGPGPDWIYDWASLKLEPATKYTIYVSMFHKDVPFYRQPGLLPDYHFSEELPIEFTTTKEDDRGFFTKWKHWQRKALWRKLTFQ